MLFTLLGLWELFEVLCKVGKGRNHVHHFLGKLQRVMPWSEVTICYIVSVSRMYLEKYQPSICNLRYSVFLRVFVPVYPAFPVLAET